jgi:glycosyltransferase 2 family protein
MGEEERISNEPEGLSLSMTGNALLRQRVFILIKLLVGLAILYWLLQRMNWNIFAGHFRQIAWTLFPLLIAFSISDRLIMAYKWRLLLRANGVGLPLRHTVALYLVSNLLGAFTPGNLGGDAYRVMALAPWGRNAEVLSTVFLERTVGLLALLFFVIASLPFSSALLEMDMRVLALIAIGGVGAILALMFIPLCRSIPERLDSWLVHRFNPVGKRFRRLLSAYADQHRHRLVLVFFFLMTLLRTGFLFFGIFLAIRMAGVDVSLGFIFAIMPSIHLILRLPISINGIGLQEGLFAFAMVLAGYTIEDGVIVSFIWRLTNFLAVYLPGSLLLWCFPATYRPSSGAMGSRRV